ncbi:TPA: hypothetical protein EYO12_03525 [Candidatus Saccharibacteria bacterium]|nr:hypothetical protein [Candidatus Saccharibacteria bacterium]HIO87899.1 hypothetical protein [Candidatus Saccharibacteria bacterium]
MTLYEYQKQALTTVINSGDTMLLRFVLGLVGESGEVAEKFKKWLRDTDGDVNLLDKAEITKELGDILWYIATLADQLGISLDEIAHTNLAKLSSRQQRNRLSGSGDNR